MCRLSCFTMSQRITLIKIPEFHRCRKCFTTASHEKIKQISHLPKTQLKFPTMSNYIIISSNKFFHIVPTCLFPNPFWNVKTTARCLRLVGPGLWPRRRHRGARGGLAGPSGGGAGAAAETYGSTHRGVLQMYSGAVVG